MSKTTKKKNKSRQKRKTAYRARHRLHSINRDARSLQKRVFSVLSSSGVQIPENWPWISNKQCGSWYLPPSNADSNLPEVYFKSTDGHVGTYGMSLKRLNLPLLELLHRYEGCFLVDSSVRKVLPDSFSRTIPIWACVINRIVQIYRRELGISCHNEQQWDTNLYTPSSVVSPEEHNEINNLIDSRVKMLYKSNAIVDIKRLVGIMNKPVRASWVADGVQHGDTQLISSSEKNKLDRDNFFVIICCNPSFYIQNAKNHITWINDAIDRCIEGTGYYYTPGAADDEATWARNLTHELFWRNKDRILQRSLSEDCTDKIIDSIVMQQQTNSSNEFIDHDEVVGKSNWDRIGVMNISIGSRRAGRPPECWVNFDAVLNVTENEYANMKDSIDQTRESRYYLQLPVAEGKRDKKELEKWIPVGLAFLIQHIQRGRRVLVHCAQGRDRSVAIVLALVTFSCPLEYPLRLHDNFKKWDLSDILSKSDPQPEDSVDAYKCLYKHSGLLNALVDVLLKDSGHHRFLDWIHDNVSLPKDIPLADKESLRIALHLIGQDRELAHPTRSTMQKLNRFFMSSCRYRCAGGSH